MVSRTAPTLALLAALAALHLPAAQAAGPLPVPTLAVGAAATLSHFEIEGTLQAVQQATVAAQTQGRVLALAVKLGDRVKAGQVLARIDSREQQAGLAGSVAATAQAQAALVQAEQQAQRTRDLRAQGFVSAAALDDAQARLKVAQGALQQAQAGRSQALLSQGFATVTAPFDGVVLATQAEVGDMATPGRALVTLYAPGRLRVVLQLPASRSAAARAATADVVLPDGRHATPMQRTEAPGSDPTSQTVEWRLDLPVVASAGLLPGQPVQVVFSGAAPVGLSIPSSAVLQRGELTAVYAAQDGRFVLKAVRLGVPQGVTVPVLAGLKAGERIAADPVRAGLLGATPATPATPESR
jgi:RND family efflux transporter MFP subunit